MQLPQYEDKYLNIVTWYLPVLQPSLDFQFFIKMCARPVLQKASPVAYLNNNPRSTNMYPIS